MHNSTSALILLLFLNFVHGLNVIDSPLLTQNIAIGRTILVDANGGGDFKSLQPRSKPYIFMRGEGRGRTAIVWSQSSLHDYDSATFIVEAPHFVAFGITFKCNLDQICGSDPNCHILIAHTLDTKSVAAVVGADKAAFYQCGFFSNHNTLFDYKGRHYYDDCYIQGSVDFIFGRGQAMFHDCEVFVMKNGRVEIGGSVTAHHRNSRKENNGFVFVKGKVYGVGDVYLGRPKGEHSRVLFANTYLSRTVIPHGWSNWNYSGSTHNVYQAEYKCHGPGSNSKNRAPWSKQLRDEEAAPFLSIDFIKGREWLPAWF